MQWENDNLKRAYALQSTNEARSLYDEWATTYDAQLASAEYTSPTKAIDAVISHLSTSSSAQQSTQHLKILDAGCGTGLVGVGLGKKLADLNIEAEIDGLDLSTGMLDRARQTGVYKVLEEADLSKPIRRSDGEYDVVTCVGTLTQGHVGPGVLNEFVRVSRNGGLIGVTIMDAIMESGGYKAALDSLEAGANGKLKIEMLQNTEFGVTEGTTKGARLLVLRRV